ncbi:MAG: DMT family transporter [Lentisphaerae bacterium]|nr:DMT family transporter [Lentisphaerota bacterium]
MLLGSALIWAANYSVIKWGLATISHLAFNGLRYLLGAAVLALIFPRLTRWQPVARADWPRLLLFALVGHGVYQLAFVYGLSLTTAGNAAVIFATSPLWTALAGMALHRERIPRPLWTGMACCMAGVALLVIGGGAEVRFAGATLRGDAVTLGAAMLWGLSAVMQKPLLNRYPPEQVVLVALTAGAVVLSLVAIPEFTALNWAAVGWSHYAAAAASGILSVGVAFVMWSHAIHHIGPTRATTYGNIVPVLALVISGLFLHERYTARQLAGAALTLAGVWLARRKA